MIDELEREHDALADRWFVAIEGEPRGPLARSDIQRLISARKAGWETLVWHPSLADWTALSDVPDLRDLLINQQPPPLPGDSVKGPGQVQESKRRGQPLPAASTSHENVPVSPIENIAPERSRSASRTMAHDSFGLRKTAKTAVWGLYGIMVVGGISAVSTVGEVNLIANALNGQLITQERAASVDVRQAAISLIWLISYVITAVLFIRWLRQAYDRAAKISTSAIRYTKAWTIWGWIIPIGFLYIPYRITKDMWRAAKTESGDHMPVFISGWWGLWLCMNALEYTSFRLGSSSDLNTLLVGSFIALLSAVCSIPAAVLAARVVNDLTHQLSGAGGSDHGAGTTSVQPKVDTGAASSDVADSAEQVMLCHRCGRGWPRSGMHKFLGNFYCHDHYQAALHG